MSYKCERIEPTESEETRKLYKFFKSDIRSGFTRVDVGNVKYCLPIRYEKHAKEIENFQVRDDDTWLISFPRSGSTWSQEMVWMVGNDLDFERGKVSIMERFPTLESSVIIEIDVFKKRYPDFKIFEYVNDSLNFVSNMPSPRFIKCHLPWELLPKQLISSKTKAKIIYIARNPKDVCVSYFYFSRSFEHYTGDLNTFCDLFLSDNFIYTPFWAHIAGYCERRNRNNVMLITYESMKKDIGAIIRKLATFLGKQITDEQLENLKKHLSFESMKTNESLNFKHIALLWKQLGYNLHNDDFIRQGNIGTHKDELTQEYVKKFDEWIVRNMEKYKIPQVPV